MITDIFQKRYPSIFNFPRGVPHEMYVFLQQGAQIIFHDLRPAVPEINVICFDAYNKLVRELGYDIHRGESNNSAQACINVLCEGYDSWIATHGDPEQFVSVRFSLLELLFADIESALYKPSYRSKGFSLFRRHKPQTPEVGTERPKQMFRAAVHELNVRFREAGLPLQYHNGLFQISSDKTTATQIDEPFWNLLKDRKWTNVDIDIKEAIDRRDNNDRDAALYAMKALESTIKIISDEKGWTRGHERGAANFIDNLVSSANGRFIETWEADQLKGLYRDLRNPHGHGPGSAPQPSLSYHQQNWLIESCMIWIKSLINRM